MIKASLVAAALAAAALSPVAASATTIVFSYDGVGEDTPDVVSHGSGSISFSGTGALTLANLTGFQFSQTTTITDPSLAGAGTFTYGVADLTRFAGVYSNGFLSVLSLLTRPVADPSGYLDDQAFSVAYRAGSSNQFSASTLFDDADTATEGAINFAPGVAAVPEPATWLMMIVGMSAVGIAMRKRPARALSKAIASTR